MGVGMNTLIAIDPGSSAGFAAFLDGRCVWCAQSAPKRERLAAWREMLIAGETVIGRAPDRVVIEGPCYAANQGRSQGVTSDLAEHVGELRALAWSLFGVEPESLRWDRWQAVAHKGRVLGESRDRSLWYAREVAKVPDAWLVGPRGGVLWDAATAVAIGGAACSLDHVNPTRPG